MNGDKKKYQKNKNIQGGKNINGRKTMKNENLLEIKTHLNC